MLCHDQHLDRRVVAQASVLIAQGHSVRLLAFSFEGETSEETTPEGILLTRIGLRHIIPENRTYVGYMARQHKLNQYLGWGSCRFPRCAGALQRLFVASSRVNWYLYKALLLARYRNSSLHDPLPFRSAFIGHALNYPSDLVQVHDLPALEAGAELAAGWSVPLVYDAHELYPEQKSFSGAQRRICARAEALQIKKADLVFAVNESIGEEMVRRYGIAKPMTLLNAMDPPPQFDADARYDLLRAKLGLSPRRRILLFQGGFAPHRNLEALIEAMVYVRDFDIDLVMMGFGTFGDTLKRKAEKLQLLGRRVHFLQAVPQSELLQHSASADVGVIPYPHVDLNSYYCTPNKLFEFIQAGLPILANDSPELNKFVRDNGFGHSARMRTAKEIAAGIDSIFASEALSTWSSEIKRARKGLAWCVQGDMYAAAMQKLLASRG